jgi:hypothetical protein
MLRLHWHSAVFLIFSLAFVICCSLIEVFHFAGVFYVDSSTMVARFVECVFDFGSLLLVVADDGVCLCSTNFLSFLQIRTNWQQATLETSAKTPCKVFSNPLSTSSTPLVCVSVNRKPRTTMQRCEFVFARLRSLRGRFVRFWSWEWAFCSI